MDWRKREFFWRGGGTCLRGSPKADLPHSNAFPPFFGNGNQASDFLRNPQRTRKAYLSK